MIHNKVDGKTAIVINHKIPYNPWYIYKENIKGGDLRGSACFISTFEIAFHALLPKRNGNTYHLVS